MTGYYEQLVDTLPISEDARLLVLVDESPSCPRGDWDFATGALTVNGDSRRMDVPPVHEFPGDLRRAHDELGGFGRRYRDNEAVIRWAKIFHGITLDYSDGTYWWIDVDAWWGESDRDDSLTPERQLEIINADRDTYRAWANGEVYGVVLERRVKTYTTSPTQAEQLDQVRETIANPDLTDGGKVGGINLIVNTPPTITEDPIDPDVEPDWAEAEGDSALWGCYLDDDDYTAWDVASEYFTLTDDELKIVNANRPKRKDNQ